MNLNVYTKWFAIHFMQLYALLRIRRIRHYARTHAMNKRNEQSGYFTLYIVVWHCCSRSVAKAFMWSSLFVPGLSFSYLARALSLLCVQCVYATIGPLNIFMAALVVWASQWPQISVAEKNTITMKPICSNLAVKERNVWQNCQK